VETWQPKRQFFNTSWWFYGSKEKFDAADKTNLVLSNWCLLSYFRSIKSRNSGLAEVVINRRVSKVQSRGEETEYLEFINGEKSTNQIFSKELTPLGTE
jgi:hypothetical protein